MKQCSFCDFKSEDPAAFAAHMSSIHNWGPAGPMQALSKDVEDPGRVAVLTAVWVIAWASFVGAAYVRLSIIASNFSCPELQSGNLLIKVIMLFAFGFWLSRLTGSMDRAMFVVATTLFAATAVESWLHFQLLVTSAAPDLIRGESLADALVTCSGVGGDELFVLYGAPIVSALFGVAVGLVGYRIGRGLTRSMW